MKKIQIDLYRKLDEAIKAKDKEQVKSIAFKVWSHNTRLFLVPIIQECIQDWLDIDEEVAEVEKLQRFY